MRTIYYCAAPTGAGKTHALVQRTAAYIDQGQTVILVQPTKLVCQQTADDIKTLFPTLRIELVNQDTVDEKVGAYLWTYLKRPYDGPHVIIITWAAFIQFRALDRPERFHLIFDEIPQAFIADSIRVPESHALFTGTLSTTPRGPVYDLVTVKDTCTVRRVAENLKNDKVNDVFQPIARKLCHKKYLTYVRRVAYEGLMAGSQMGRDLTIFSMLDPSVFRGFRSVLMVGARAKETILFKWFSSIGVTFARDEELEHGLRYREHQNGHLIDFYYACEQNWSFTCQSKDESLRPLFEKAAIELMGDREFCWQDNKRNELTSPFNGVTKAHQLPHHPHGLNSFQSVNHAVLLSSLNYTSEESRFLSEFCGIDRTEQKIALAYHSAYQTYNRVSTRDPNNDSRKIIVLPDKQNAAWQQARFPGSTLRSLGIDSRTPLPVGRPAIHASSSARKKASRDREAARQMESLNRVIEATHEKELVFQIGDCDVINLKDIGDYVTHLQGSIIAHKFDPRSTCLISSNADFVETLRGYSKRQISKKTESMLISPGHFLPVEGEVSSRAKINAVFGKHVYLDVENGRLKHRDIPKLFPDLELIIYSSYSHTASNPRYRVVFLTNSIMAPEVYTSIYQQIIQVIETAGYGSGSVSTLVADQKPHGIDYKPNISDLFYLPSQPREGRGFFYYHSKDRSPLNVMDWINHAIPTRFDQENSRDYSAVSPDRTIVGDQAEVCERALQAFWKDTVLPGTGHMALNKLNFTLIQGGVDDVSRDTTLTVAAQNARSRRDRMSDKRRMMRTKKVS